MEEMISEKQMIKLKTLFQEDGIELSDASALEVGQWLLARARLVATKIPDDKKDVFIRLKDEIASINEKTVE